MTKAAGSPRAPAAPDSSRILWSLIAVQLTLGSSFSIVPPILPLLLPSLGVLDSHKIEVWSGVVIGATPFSATLMSPFWGRVAEKKDARTVVAIACIAAASSMLLMSIASSVGQLLCLRIAMGAFGGHAAAAMLLITAHTPSQRLGRSVGWLSTAQMAGLLIGPLLGGAIADASGSMRAPFLVSACITLLVACSIGLVPRAPSVHRTMSGDPLPRPPAGPRRGLVQMLVPVVFLAQLALVLPQPIISLHVRSVAGPRDDIATLAGIAFSAIGLSGLITAPLMGRLSDRLSGDKLLLGAALASCALLLPQAFAQHFDTFVLERFACGLFISGIIPVANAMIGRTTAERGRAYGLTTAAAFAGAALGPVFGGIIAAQYGIPAVFVSSAIILALLSGWIVYFSMSESHRYRL